MAREPSLLSAQTDEVLAAVRTSLKTIQMIDKAAIIAMNETNLELFKHLDSLFVLRQGGATAKNF